MFEYWYIIGAPDYVKGRKYLYRIDGRAWIYHQSLQARDGSDDDLFDLSIVIYEKPCLSDHPGGIMAIVLIKGQCMYLCHREKH